MENSDLENHKNDSANKNFLKNPKEISLKIKRNLLKKFKSVL